MTANQIKYQELLEKERSNRTQEALGMGQLQETRRSNLVKERETERSNREKESTNWFSARSLAAHQRADEAIRSESNQIGWGNLNEQRRSNAAREAETKRSNLAKEAETKRSNLTHEEESHRANVARETEENRSNVSRETETNRSNTQQESLRSRELAETSYHNRATESQKNLELGLRAAGTVFSGIKDVASAIGQLSGGFVTSLGGNTQWVIPGTATEVTEGSLIPWAGSIVPK